LDASLGFDETGKLLQAAPELTALSVLWSSKRSSGTGNAGGKTGEIRWTILNGLDDFHRLERVFAGAAERGIGRGCIHGLQDGRSVLVARNFELVQITDNDRLMFASKRTRNLAGQRHGAE